MSTPPQSVPSIGTPPGKILSLRGARTHNLKNIDLDLPLRCWISIVGVGGAGKTSLARDTILAEAHRRYLESLSLSTRQYLDRIERPDLDRLDGLPPCLAPGSQSLARGPRSTLSTVLNLQELLATLFARLGTIHCPDCQAVIRPQSPQAAADFLAELPDGTRIQLAFRADDPARLQTAGFTRFIQLPLTSGDTGPEYSLVDRLIISKESADETRLRLTESIGTCYQQAQGRCLVLSATPHPQEPTEPIAVAETNWYPLHLTRDPLCPRCGRESILPEPALFLFRSPLGACRRCQGTGRNPSPSAKRRSPLDLPVCSACKGTRLCPEARNIRIHGTSLDELTAEHAGHVHSWLANLKEKLSPERLPLVVRPLEELLRRIELLERLGLDYLSWNRATASLSTGERQRLSIASLLAHRTAHALYLLDEPTRGLHPLDRVVLIEALSELKSQGNTLLVVEHDPLFLQVADWVVELGPGSGKQGGNVLFSGPIDHFPAQASPGLLIAPRAAQYSSRAPSGHFQLHRSDIEDVPFSVGTLSVVTGVSGSGKSRLILQELASEVRSRLDQNSAPKHSESLPWIDLVAMDERSTPLSSHSTPSTLLQVWPAIRSHFAASEEARRRNFDLQAFGLARGSLGRCSTCEGRGLQSVDLQFLPEAKILCPACRGSRYISEILEITYRGLSIAEVLDLDLQQALTHFRGDGTIPRRLTPAVTLGLESLHLGQPISDLSSGEVQRLKLARHLAKRAGGPTLFLLDEPTSGLHLSDVRRLADSLEQLVSGGHTVIAIDHHPLLLNRADEILDLGTEGGRLHPRVVARGTFAEVLADSRSATATFWNGTHSRCTRDQ